ncbi:MAG TPA: GDP-mannose 4,6-dehydratase [Thermoleophilaceae bacterium]|nr:GDP-mannose 4,6-dehydratase [Thermoleophilaceae bacterium]
MPGPTLVTGAGGFAGRHLLAHLEDRGERVIGPSSAELDLRDAAAVRERVREAAPERVYHLAALASVARSWQDPARTLADNQAMTLNLLEAVRLEAPGAQVVLVSSGELYGAPRALPVDEDAPLAPENPYAVSKAAGDLLGGVYASAHGLAIVRARPFNHAGPGQSDDYVVGTLTRQIARAEAAGENSVLLRTGNPDSGRDFTDVRDVVRAYALLAGAAPGIYNVASGRTQTVRGLIEALRELTELDIRHEVDPERLRARDVPEICGSARRLEEATGWKPEISLRQTLADTLAAWRAQDAA